MANTLKFGNGIWATKEDSVLAYNDENGNYKPLPFEFERDTNATVVNKKGLIETVGNNIPRIDFLGNNKGALLLEPERTNLIPYSEDFSIVNWSKSNSSVTSGFTSPDGSNNAYKLVENTSNSAHRIFNGSGLSVSGNVSMSVFAKKGGRDFIRLTNNNIVGGFFDLNNGIVLGVSAGVVAKIEDFGNDWYRCSITQNGVANERLIVYLSNNGIDTSYTGDGTSGVYIYGAQIEQGDYPTSYIPTQGGTVTRAAESCEQTTPSGVIGQTEGTLYGEFDFKNDSTSTRRLLCLTDGSASNRITTYISGLNKLSVYIVNGGVAQADIVSVTPPYGTVKYAVSYANNSIKIYLNGSQVGSDTSSTIPATSNLYVGSENGNLPSYFNWTNCQLYNTVLTDAELIALTTI